MASSVFYKQGFFLFLIHNLNKYATEILDLEILSAVLLDVLRVHWTETVWLCLPNVLHKFHLYLKICLPQDIKTVYLAALMEQKVPNLHR